MIGAGDDKFVQVYDLASGEQRAEPVTTGISNGTMVEVSGEGLKEGDLVVLNEAELRAAASRKAMPKRGL